MDVEDCNDFPPEMKQAIDNLEKAIADMESCVTKLTSVPLSETHERLKPLDRAKFDSMSVYAVTSLYWAYLRTRGIDPKEQSLPKELERIKEAMIKAKQIGDKHLQPKINVGAAKRFVRSGLWEPSKDDSSVSSSDTDPSPPKKLCHEQQPAKTLKDKKH